VKGGRAGGRLMADEKSSRAFGNDDMVSKTSP